MTTNADPEYNVQQAHDKLPVFVVAPPEHPAASDLAQQFKEYTGRTRVALTGMANGFKHRLLNPDTNTVFEGAAILEMLPELAHNVHNALFVVVQPERAAFSQWLDWHMEQLLGPVEAMQTVRSWSVEYDAYYEAISKALPHPRLNGRTLLMTRGENLPQDYLPFFGIGPDDPRWNKALPIVLSWMTQCPLTKNGNPDVMPWELYAIWALQKGHQLLQKELQKSQDRLETLLKSHEKLLAAQSAPRMTQLNLDAVADKLLAKYRQSLKADLYEALT